MATTSDRWTGLKRRFSGLPVVVRRLHRFLGVLWLLSFAVTTAVGQLPGPSIPGLSFIALILTGTYLLARPWVRGAATPAERLRGLADWTLTPAVVIRRTHRIAAGLFVLVLVVVLSSLAAGGTEPQLLLVPIVALLAYMALTGLYMFFRPWVNRVRAR